jgi:hypothetical protein
MSKIIMVFEPEGAFNFLLACIREYPQFTRVTAIGLHLVNFIADPTIQELLNPAADLAGWEDQLEADWETAFQVTLSNLNRSIQSIQKQLDKIANSKGNPPAKGSKGNSKPPPKTFSAIAGARPPNPNLVVDLAHLRLADEDRPKLEIICGTLNMRLGNISLPQAMLAAVRWTAHGNLVVTGAPNATSHSLQAAAPYISTILTQAFKLPSDHALPARPNVKWSKLTINSVPTGASDTCGAYTHTENHNSLKMNNPTYTALTVTQQPSWVCPPTSYSPGAVSSLSVAFKDPDSSKLKAILAEHYLYIHSHRASICKWKYHQPKHKEHAKEAATPHSMHGESVPDDNEEDIEIQLTPMPPMQSATSSKPTASTNIEQSSRLIMKAAPTTTATINKIT